MSEKLFGEKIFLWQILLVLWLLQLGWLAWYFAPEAMDLTRRLAGGRIGEAVRQEDSYYRWLRELKAILPPDSTYIFVDSYEAGQDIKARYHLYPRKMIRLNPLATPSILFEAMTKEQAEYLILRECNLQPQWQFLFPPQGSVFQAVPQSRVGMVLKVDPRQMTGGFYD